MSNPGKKQRIEEFLRKSLLGDELINTQFHLYSARSSLSRKVLKPRVLCVNNILLAKSSKYFLDLLSSDINPSDPSLIDLTDDNDVPDNAEIEEYGYGSDSDLEDCNDPIPEVPKDPDSSSKHSSEIRVKDDDELSDDGSESVSSDMFVMSPEHPRSEDPFALSKDGARSIASSETAVQDAASNQKSTANRTTMRLGSLGSRHILVKDTAFQTLYALLNYLYTDQVSFLPLSSVTPSGQPPEDSSTDTTDEPRCSPKSMYRLASKVGLDNLRADALDHIRNSLTEHNIIKELSCNLASRHLELLDMELDVLYWHIGSPPVVANFPALAQRIANKELPHGADIIVGIYSRLLTQRNPRASNPKPTALTLSGLSGSVQSKVATKVESPRDVPESDVEIRLSSVNNEPCSLSSVLSASPACVGSLTPQLSVKGKQKKGGKRPVPPLPGIDGKDSSYGEKEPSLFGSKLTVF